MIPLTLTLTLGVALGGPPPEPAPGRPAVPEGLRCLVAAYPSALCEARPEGAVTCDGAVVPWDDGRDKTHQERLAAPDLQDMMDQRYPAPGSPAGPPPLDHEPGRIRYEPLLRRVYGDSAREVRARLATIPWLPRHGGAKIRVTTVGGVHDKLAAVSRELDRLPAAQRKFVEKVSGTFLWRKIAGTERLSAHSFAIAIDVGVKHSDYWRWRKPGPDGRLRWRNRFPLAVVEIFERHGFIWGGRWYHFDTMHFEYRPELLDPRCRAPGE